MEIIVGPAQPIASSRHRKFTGVAVFLLVCLLLTIALWGPPATAHPDDQGSNDTAAPDDLCEFPAPEWRAAQDIAGVDIRESHRCRPDNPAAVATAVRGTNNVPMDVLAESGYAPDAVEKGADVDGDGDPDEIDITLEVNELNGGGVDHHVAPGVSPVMWTFSPKTRGMLENGSHQTRHVRAPSPPIRVEEGDSVSVTVENTHYLPHTIHFHGVDHPYEDDDGDGNDGVPQTSERPILPGENRTYEFTPRQAGTMFYHCHVVPNTHVEMGLSGMFVVTENESDNTVQTFNPGAGLLRYQAAADDPAGTYDLHYQALDRNLTRLLEEHDDPRELATAVNREHDVTEATMDYYLLNGRSFPYTVQESPIVVEPDREYRLRVVNSGPRDVAVHTHGHKFTVDAYDGVALDPANEIQRDVASIAPAQRVDLRLNTTIDGTNAYDRGIWTMHDHREAGITTDGISPGGNINLIAYASYLNESTALPRTETDLGHLFNESYYAGEIPYWADLDRKLAENDTAGTPTGSAVDHWAETGPGRMRMRTTAGGAVMNENRDELPMGCEEIQGNETITVAAGRTHAAQGGMFAYNQSEWQFDTCTRVTVTLENDDDVRHQWMVHGLLQTTYPQGMFTLEADAGGTVTGTFITPSFDTQLQLHCSLPKHEAMGMSGTVTVGNGNTSMSETPNAPRVTATTPGDAAGDDGVTPGGTSKPGISTIIPSAIALLIALVLLGAFLRRKSRSS